MSDIKFVEAEVVKLNLKKNDTLVVKLKGDQFTGDDLSSLREHFKLAFKDNPVKVLLFCLPDNHDMVFEVVSEEKSCNNGSCSGCGCSKKKTLVPTTPTDDDGNPIELPPEENEDER